MQAAAGSSEPSGRGWGGQASTRWQAVVRRLRGGYKVIERRLGGGWGSRCVVRWCEEEIMWGIPAMGLAPSPSTKKPVERPSAQSCRPLFLLRTPHPTGLVQN